MVSDKEIKRQVLQLYISGIDADTIAKVVEKSKRTVYRYIKAYENGECDIDMSNIVTGVKKFREQELEDLLEILSSKLYIDKVSMALDRIDETQIDNELKKNGIRGVTGFIGTLIDKRLKSYTVELERENLKLKKDIVTSKRTIVFEGENANDTKLSQKYS